MSVETYAKPFLSIENIVRILAFLSVKTVYLFRGHSLLLLEGVGLFVVKSELIDLS